MKRYFDLTEPEKLALSQDDFTNAVKIEGINRGIKPPITIGAALNQVSFTGFGIPADVTIFYQVVAPAEYGSGKETGLCYRTADEARIAMQNAFAVYESGYGADKRHKMATGDFHVRETYLTLTPQKWFSLKFEEFYEDGTEYKKLCEECSADLSDLRQNAYNAKVLAQKRATYMELAKGDLEIAKAFWAKTEGAEFPNE